jgi:hypothetical protein
MEFSNFRLQGGESGRVSRLGVYHIFFVEFTTLELYHYLIFFIDHWCHCLRGMGGMGKV